MLAVGLCQECSIADSSCQMLNWLCSGTDLSVVMRQNNLATLRQMNGLDRLSNLLCPEMEAHDELKPIGKITTPVFCHTSQAADMPCLCQSQQQIKALTRLVLLMIIDCNARLLSRSWCKHSRGKAF